MATKSIPTSLLEHIAPSRKPARPSSDINLIIILVVMEEGRMSEIERLRRELRDSKDENLRLQARIAELEASHGWPFDYNFYYNLRSSDFGIPDDATYLRREHYQTRDKLRRIRMEQPYEKYTSIKEELFENKYDMSALYRRYGINFETLSTPLADLLKEKPELQYSKEQKRILMTPWEELKLAYNTQNTAFDRFMTALWAFVQDWYRKTRSGFEAWSKRVVDPRVDAVKGWINTQTTRIPRITLRKPNFLVRYEYWQLTRPLWWDMAEWLVAVLLILALLFSCVFGYLLWRKAQVDAINESLIRPVATAAPTTSAPFTANESEETTAAPAPTGTVITVPTATSPTQFAPMQLATLPFEFLPRGSRLYYSAPNTLSHTPDAVSTGK
ncbi:MAG: hypothetical protein M3P98_04500 [bacterium]|nr:hypothetical protein [bacterium]